MKRLFPVLLVAACGRTEPQLLVPTDVDVAWDSSFDGVGDGLVAVVPVDVMLYDRATGDPLADALVEVAVPEGEAGLVGEVVVTSPDDSSGAWDARRDRWVAVPSDALAPAVAFRTDATGLVRLNVVVDAFGGQRVPVVVSAAGLEESFAVVAR